MHGKQSPQQKAWRQTYIVDKRQIDSLAKDVPKLFPFSTTIAPFNQKLSKMLSQAQHAQLKISKQEASTFQRLADVSHDIQSLRNVLKFYDQSNQYLVKVQHSSENILGKLEQFRGKMGAAYQALADEEDTLDEELELMSKKIEAMGRGEEMHNQKENLKNNNKEVKVWERNLQSAKQKRSQPQVNSSPNDDRIAVLQQKMKEREKAVESIEKLVVGLGKNLGWPEQDHNDFISIWHRGGNKNYFQIQEELQGYFSFYTAEEIQQHMNKYIKFRKLTEEKKELIVQYKNLKEEKKMEELKVMNLQRDNSREHREREEMKRKQEKEQMEMKAKLSQWKEKKHQDKKEEEERKARLEYHKKQEEAIRKRQADERNKDLLQQWKQEEAQKKQEEIRRIKSAKKPVAIDHEAEERIRARQELLIRKKVELVNDKKREEQMVRQKATKIKEDKFVKYSHVTPKLDKKTTAIKEKERQKFDGKEKKEANTFGGQLLMTGVRATPSWMK